MRIDIVSIMPGMFQGPFAEGMVRKAVERGLVEVRLHDLRDFTHDRHRTTDDYPFGGGPGMVLKPEPIAAALAACRSSSAGTGVGGGTAAGKPPRVVLTTPQGRRLDQALAFELAREAHLIFVCGRYEGVDERVRQTLVDDEISIGDYVLTGGELPAMVVVDAVVRLIPGVLGAEDGAMEDSFASGLLEGPQYTRPREWNGMAVPDVLLSGDHARIARWRRRMALWRTRARRPDLLADAALSDSDRADLAVAEEPECGPSDSREHKSSRESGCE